MRTTSAVLLLAALGAGAAASPATAAPAKPAQRSAPAATTTFLTDPQAQAQAESSGAPVTATADSTGTSTTTANPDGSFTTTVSSEPTQALVNGTWTALNATLQQNPDGTYSPAVSAAPLALSGGGSTTLATMTADNRTLTISWPTTLPAPAVSGNTATYANVYSGVDLQITTDDQGGFSDVLIVHSATAAANQALNSINLTTSSTGGLVLSTDASGDLIASASAGDPALISFGAPQIWDSSPPPASETTVTSTDGVTVDANTGDPANSTADYPGATANVATIPVSVSGNTITLTPPASILTGPSTVYPVYIDPAWHNHASSNAARWTQVFSGWATNSSYYNKNENLRVGVCPKDLPGVPPSGPYSCNGMGAARTIVQMNLPRQLRESTDVHQATLNTTEDWSPSCNAEPVRVWKVPGTISRSTDWNNQPALSGTSSNYVAKPAAFGYPGCGYYKNDLTFDVTSFIAADAGEQSYQTFTFQAGDETPSSTTSELYWKKFKSGSTNFTLAVTYNYPPNRPDHLSTNPGGGCHSSENNPAVIGNDDVTFYSHAYDPDGDNSLKTTFNLYNTSGTSVFNTTVSTGDNAKAQTTILRAGMQGFGMNGATTAYKYYYQTTVKDDFNLTSQASDKCWILYNPKGPQKPTVGLSPGTVPLGGQVSATFSTPNCSASTNPCPTQYVYQQGASAPVTVTANSTSHDWSGNITITQVGPVEITVYGIDSAGNVSESSTQPIIGTVPATKYKDGYFSGGQYPDLLWVDNGSKPSLWLAQGNGDGTLNPPVDIGSQGDAIQPGTDGRGDWNGAIILHGDFTGRNVQDVMAYYPPPSNNSPTPPYAAGTGIVVGGTGDAFTLDPWSGNTGTADPTLMAYNPAGTPPIQLTAAGNASGLSTGTDDLIGIAKNASGQGELDLFTSSSYPNGGGTASTYGYCQTITATAPGGSSDNWANYTLATAGNPSNTALFALNTSSGALYESSGPFTLQLPPDSPPGSTVSCPNSVINAPKWTTIPTSGAWGTPPTGLALAQADINHEGATEIWVYSGSNSGSNSTDAYTLSGTTLTYESPDSISFPSNDWPLNDGNPNLGGASATTATDSLTGTSAAITGNAAWAKDSYFDHDLSFDGTNSYLTPPAATIQSGAYPSISIWFKTKSPGVIVSVQQNPLTSGSTTNGGYNPVLYIGKNGLLYGEWWNSAVDPIVSTYKVDNGIWHHAVLTSTRPPRFLPPQCATDPSALVCQGQQTLTLDGQTVGGAAGNPTGNWSNLDFGAGYAGGGWPNYPNNNAKNGNEGWLTYFNGEISNINLSH